MHTGQDPERYTQNMPPVSRAFNPGKHEVAVLAYIDKCTHFSRHAVQCTTYPGLFKRASDFYIFCIQINRITAFNAIAFNHDYGLSLPETHADSSSMALLPLQRGPPVPVHIPPPAALKNKFI
jgi:hypothetical protein